MTPRSDIWLVADSGMEDFGDRMLTGAEALSIQGFPLQLAMKSKLGNSQLKDLAGNAFSANTFMALYIALLVHFPKLDSNLEKHDLEALIRLQSLMSS